ncbi:hypothetical protein [Alteromonas gracilis]|uniref:hypothetical protein n=1 Tax=Alteromonas gracilis TaxID=1479524 RepID=UPI0036F1E0F4
MMKSNRVVSNNEKSRGISFLLGAVQSGTSPLYKLLCLHPSVAYISNYEDRFTWLPSAIAVKYANKYSELKVDSWFNKGNAYFEKRPWAQKIFPTPNEGEAVYTACGFPSRPALGGVPNNTIARASKQYFSKALLKSNASIFFKAYCE